MKTCLKVMAIYFLTLKVVNGYLTNLGKANAFDWSFACCIYPPSQGESVIDGNFISYDTVSRACLRTCPCQNYDYTFSIALLGSMSIDTIMIINNESLTYTQSNL